MKKTFFYLLKRLRKKRIFSLYQSHLWTTIYSLVVLSLQIYGTHDMIGVLYLQKYGTHDKWWKVFCICKNMEQVGAALSVSSPEPPMNNYLCCVLNLQKYGTDKIEWNLVVSAALSVSQCTVWLGIFKPCLVWLGESASHSQGQLPWFFNNFLKIQLK